MREYMAIVFVFGIVLGGIHISYIISVNNVTWKDCKCVNTTTFGCLCRPWVDYCLKNYNFNMLVGDAISDPTGGTFGKENIERCITGVE